jgi:malonate transporter and related proteins
MDALFSVFSVTFPFFALIFCGFMAARSHLLPTLAIPGLNTYVLYFALPCLLFRFGSSSHIQELLNPVLIGLYATSALILVSWTIAITRLQSVTIEGKTTHFSLVDAAFGALVAVFPNTGFMGVPLLVALLGPHAAGPTISTILVDLVMTSTLCIALAQAGGHKGARWQDSVKRSLKGAASNPLPWAIAAGALVSVWRVELPSPLSQVIKMLADSASPVALFTIGAVLWRSGQQAGSHTSLRMYLPIALIKLLLHPLLMALLGVGLIALGAPLSQQQLTVLVLVAALPSASNVSLLAERYGADNGRIARIIMASTALAFLTFTALAWLLGMAQR